MDCAKVGRLILSLRKEQGLTQKQLAARLGLSDKTISKWERGLGCPDVSLLRGLGRALNVDIEKILEGDLGRQRPDTGNMKRTQFYLCPQCGNILLSTGKGQLSCCGRPLAPLTARPASREHPCRAEKLDGDWYVTFDHEMDKGHYLTFAAYLNWDRALLVRLYPEQEAAVRLPYGRGGAGCTTAAPGTGCIIKT